MSRVEPELEGGPQPVSQLTEQLGGRLSDRATPVTHQVNVLVVVRRVAGCPVPEVGVPDHAKPFKQIKRAVDGRDVHRRSEPLYSDADLLRRRVPELTHRIQHQLPLRCHPQPTLVQGAAQRFHTRDGSPLAPPGGQFHSPRYSCG